MGRKMNAQHKTHQEGLKEEVSISEANSAYNKAANVTTMVGQFLGGERYILYSTMMISIRAL